MEMSKPNLTDAEHAELHEVLEHLGSERVWALRASEISGRTLRAHLLKCTTCRRFQDDVLEAKLAALEPSRRRGLEKVAAGLAKHFLGETREQ